jgi:hypothetical protein
MNETTYQHRQRARILSAILLAVILAVGFVALTVKDGPALLPTLFVLTFVQLMMASLNVRVTRKQVDVRFGMGWPRFRFTLDRIVAVEVVRNAPWWGWGIRLTPRGWLFNVSGLDAVEIEFVDGNRVRIGTDDPQGLAAAIRDALSQSETEDALSDGPTWQGGHEFGDPLESVAGEVLPSTQLGAESGDGVAVGPAGGPEFSTKPLVAGTGSTEEVRVDVQTDAETPPDVAGEAGSHAPGAETEPVLPEPKPDPTGSTTGDVPDAAR